ncbi:hypothetical protein TNIN_105291 [Trichonephila inaurata madagascariensis]|uniref:Uncharacterized protein n=1 Tax=Trichonephila inaurata madagascariensis TaxID=2747483 RepID=A0A8X6XPX8_9ARAC|nr:hypothetical protein TNIN_105291 [Trichonephila inaurata madagascariensis]
MAFLTRHYALSLYNGVSDCVKWALSFRKVHLSFLSLFTSTVFPPVRNGSGYESWLQNAPRCVRGLWVRVFIRILANVGRWLR